MPQSIKHRACWLALLTIFLVACQPIRPEVELMPADPTSEASSESSSEVITNTATISATAPITASEVITPASTPPDTATPDTSTPYTVAAIPSTPTTGTSCPALAPDNASPFDIDVVADWQVGDQRSYATSQERIDVEGDNEAISLASTTPITVTVVSVEEDGYVLEWQYGQSILGETDVAVPDPMAGLFESPLQVRFQYTTDRDGAYVELLNIADLQAQLAPLFDQLFDAIAESDPDASPEALAAAEGIVAQLIDNPDNFEAIFTNEAQLLHTLYGFSFDSVEPLVLPDMRPNMLGGSPIPSELTITPTHYDATLNCLHVHFENIADPVAARNSIFEALQEQARQMGIPGPSESDLPSELTMIDNIYFELDLESGWPTAIRLQRTTDIGGEGRIDTASIILTETDLPR